MNREAFFSKSHLLDCCRALTDGSSIMQNTLIITRRHVFRITMFNSGFSDLQIRRHTHSEQDENKKATFYMLQWRKENLSVPSKETVFNIHKAFLLHSFPSCTLLIDTISATEMTQISNTNTVFLVRSFQTGDREHKCLSQNTPVWESSSTNLLPCQPAARPIPLQYDSPPVDLVRMLFIVPQKKQNNR